MLDTIFKLDVLEYTGKIGDKHVFKRTFVGSQLVYIGHIKLDMGGTIKIEGYRFQLQEVSDGAVILSVYSLRPYKIKKIPKRKQPKTQPKRKQPKSKKSKIPA